MKIRKKKPKENPQRRSFVETPLLTGQYPAFGIEDTALRQAPADEKKTGR